MGEFGLNIQTDRLSFDSCFRVDTFSIEFPIGKNCNCLKVRHYIEASYQSQTQFTLFISCNEIFSFCLLPQH